MAPLFTQILMHKTYSLIDIFLSQSHIEYCFTSNVEISLEYHFCSIAVLIYTTVISQVIYCVNLLNLPEFSFACSPGQSVLSRIVLQKVNQIISFFFKYSPPQGLYFIPRILPKPLPCPTYPSSVDLLLGCLLEFSPTSSIFVPLFTMFQ